MPADSTPFQHLGWDHVQGNQASDWMTDLLETNQLEASFLIELCVQISNIYFYTWSSPTTQQASKYITEIGYIFIALQFIGHLLPTLVIQLEWSAAILTFSWVAR